MTSVSVCVTKRSPAADQSVAQRLEILDDAVVHDRDLVAAETCGCALTGVGAPCVAQRVCEMPVIPEICVALACAARSATRAVLTSRCSPPLMTASPVES